jgi:hypothetical protein
MLERRTASLQVWPGGLLKLIVALGILSHAAASRLIHRSKTPRNRPSAGRGRWNLVLAVGGVSLNFAFITMAALYYTSLASGGRAVLLVAFTSIYLVRPLIKARLGRRVNVGLSIAAAGSFIAVDAYAVYRENIGDLASVSPRVYVVLVSAAILTVGAVLTGLIRVARTARERRTSALRAGTPDEP